MHGVIVDAYILQTIQTRIAFDDWRAAEGEQKNSKKLLV
jgi:hypothetical protein